MTTTTTSAFDAAGYKATTKMHWEQAAAALASMGSHSRTVARRGHGADA
jgi:hypothetical protein